MKIGVDIPTDKNVFTFATILIIVFLYLLNAGQNFENLDTSWIILLCIPYLLYHSIVRTRKYTVDFSGITAHYWDIIHVHRTWEYFSDIGVFLVYHGIYSDLSLIICSKKQWPKEDKICRFEKFELFPFSAFYMVYTPERFEEFAKFCPKITYFADKKLVDSSYKAFQRRHLQKRKERSK